MKTNDGLKEAIQLFGEGKFSEAKALFSSYFDRNQKSAEAALYMGRICIVEDALDESIDWLEKAVTLDDNSSTNHYWLGIAYGRKAQKAGVLKKPGLAKNMKKEVLRAIELDPNNLDARLALLQYYLYAPGIMGGSKEKALEQAEEIKTRNSARGYSAFGLIHEHEKAYDLAEEAYLAAVSEDPENVEHTYQLGYFYQRIERLDKALQTYQSVLEKYPKESKAYYQLGYVYRELGQYNDAIKTYESLLTQNPEETNAYYYMGTAGTLLGTHLDRAEEYLLKYLQLLTPEKNSSKAWGHYRLGIVYEKQGKKDLAKREYQVALSFDSKHEEAMKALKNLE